MRVAVVGGGTAGASAALLLARDGHQVQVFERVAEPRGIGAGILLQPLGQQILLELGLADELERCSTPVRRIDARTATGRRVLDFGYDDVLRGTYGWGVSRAELFQLLWAAVLRSGIPVRTGADIRTLTVDSDGYGLQTTDHEPLGSFDLVIGADGARSRLRRLSGLARKDVGYPWGALWCMVPDPDRIAGDVLHQRYDGTRIILGVLPTGIDQASIFWSVRSRDLQPALAASASTLARAARPYAGPFAPLLERIREGTILSARYRDVVVRSPVLVRNGRGLVLVGDAAHAMSPQLGLGASLALADAWSLAACLRAQPDDLPVALRAHASSRRAHVRWYTWCSRLMTPVFQSDLVPMAWPRDLLFEPIGRIPWVRRQFVTTLLGARTSPWTEWHPPPA